MWKFNKIVLYAKEFKKMIQGLYLQKKTFSILFSMIKQLRGKRGITTSPLPSSQKSKKTPPNFCKYLLRYYKFLYYYYYFNLSPDCYSASSSSSSSLSSSCSLLPEQLYMNLSNGSCVCVSVPPSWSRTVKLMLNWTVLSLPWCHW